jgi:hypothetical protein
MADMVLYFTTTPRLYITNMEAGMTWTAPRRKEAGNDDRLE